MARRIRFLPPGSVVEVTTRTVQGRFLLTPSPEFCEMIVGTVGRAQRKYSMVIHALVFTSNHYHMLLSPLDARQLSRFMGYVNSKIAKEVARRVGWKDKIWSRRYQSIVVWEQEAAQIQRLRYILAHGVKENLVERLRDWPGVHCAHALRSGEPLEGLWFDRTREYNARKRGKSLSPRDFATPEVVRFSPLPCWAYLSSVEYRKQVAELIAGIERDAQSARDRGECGPVLGAAAILAQSPEDKPSRIKSAPAPLVHAATKAARRSFYEAYGLFVSAFREAARRLAAGDADPGFPPGAFPPPLQFVPL